MRNYVIIFNHGIKVGEDFDELTDFIWNNIFNNIFTIILQLQDKKIFTSCCKALEIIALQKESRRKFLIDNYFSGKL